jgi:hypothetical protein
MTLKFESYGLSFRGEDLGAKAPWPRARNPVIPVGGYWVPGSPPLRSGAPE